MKQYIEKLQSGKTVQFRPRGNSMSPKIKSGQLCTIIPINNPKKNDIVLCRVKGKIYLHLIKSIQKNRFQIGNNHGKINGWIGLNNIFGKLESVGN